tara:strand:- start:191 stop:856 length:666 start_codon:yes stop_codon:yes gene_type:complete
MIKLFIKLSLVFYILLTSIAQATLLPINYNELTSNDYIVYNYGGIDYDITWASSENSERWYDRNYNYNTLLGPTIRQGWSFAGVNDIPSLTNIFTGLSGSDILSQFTRNGNFIHSFSYWNTVFTEVDTTIFMGEVLGTLDIKSKHIRSQWSWSVPINDDIASTDDLDDKKAQRTEIIGIDTSDYATFYIRKTATKPVPEPSTLMIFALGLIALASKKRLFS